MADTPETTPPEPTAAPAKPRRRRASTTKTPTATPSAAKAPRKTTSRTTASAGTPTAATSKPKAPPKPRSTKRATPRTTAKTAKTAHATKSEGGSKLRTAVVTGGIVAAVGAAAAALLTLRGSTPKPDAKRPSGDRAHQPDGTDSSKSFQAGIADEGTIPE